MGIPRRPRCLFPLVLVLGLVHVLGENGFAQFEAKKQASVRNSRPARHEADARYHELLREIQETGTITRSQEEQVSIASRRSARRAELNASLQTIPRRVRAPENTPPRVAATGKTNATKVFVVNSAYDDPDASPGDGVCWDTFFIDLTNSILECSLRAAIQEANLTPGSDSVIIRFDIISIDRGADATGGFGYDEDLDVWRVPLNHVASNTQGVLPTITRSNVHIDGTFQKDGSGVGTFDDAFCGTQFMTGDSSIVKVMIDGSLLAGIDNALSISGDSVSVVGVAVSNAPKHGVSADGASNLHLECLHVGTDHLGKAAEPNGGSGIVLDNGHRFNVTRSVISGNTDNGLVALGDTVHVSESFVGTDRTGSYAIGNALVGLQLGADAGSISHSLVSGNMTGVFITGASYEVSSSRIGVNRAAASAIANSMDGVHVAGDSNQIGGEDPNTIAFNGGAGVRVTGSGSVSIGRNSIHSNTGLGIDLGILGVTSNDLGPPHDTDVGPNGLQNFPDIGSVANLEPGSTSLAFEFFSTPSTNFEFHLFYSPTADGSGHGEGHTWAGSINGSTNGAGYYSYDDVLPSGIPDGQWLSITARNNSTAESSEFSLAHQVTAAEGIELVDTKVFLEGPYAGGSMSTTLLTEGDIPLDQPYDDAVFNGSLAEFDDPVSVVSVPVNTVDWVTIALRTGTALADEVSRRVAFVRNDGVLVGLDGSSSVWFAGLVAGSYYVVICHRNHLCAMSSAAVDLTSGTGTWDFSTALAKAYTTGGSPMKHLGGGVYALFAGDNNVDGQVTAPDFNQWNAETTAGANGYRRADHNLDGNVTAPDFNQWNANTTAGASSRVPD